MHRAIYSRHSSSSFERRIGQTANCRICDSSHSQTDQRTLIGAVRQGSPIGPSVRRCVHRTCTFVANRTTVGRYGRGSCVRVCVCSWLPPLSSARLFSTVLCRPTLLSTPTGSLFQVGTMQESSDCSSTCFYENLPRGDIHLRVIPAYLRGNGDAGWITMCTKHRMIHVCDGGSSCRLDDQGTCVLTNRSYDNLASNRPIPDMYVSDGCSNASLLPFVYDSLSSEVPKSRCRGTARKYEYKSEVKPTTEGDGDDQEKEAERDIFIRSILRELDDEGPLFRDDAAVLNSTLLSLFSNMHKNRTRTHGRRRLSPNVWKDSIVQILRSHNNQDLLQHVTVASTVKFIANTVLERQQQQQQRRQQRGGHKALWWQKKNAFRNAKWDI